MDNDATIKHDDICMQCDKGQHYAYMHNHDGCQVVGCSCVLTYTPVVIPCSKYE